ncbi:MAG: VanZ family protein [Nanoarchaeota archaeon]
MIEFFEKRKWLSWIIVFLIASLIFYLSSLSFKGYHVFSLNSVFYHFLAFFWFAFFLIAALLKGRKRFLAAVLIALAYAVSDEFHQLFVPFRNFSISDILTDSAGIFLAGFAYALSLQYSNNS